MWRTRQVAVTSFFSEVRETLIPGSDARQGPLPLLLILMTLVTGIIDSFSFLKLGHVFVANATGNILFMGFALAHVPGFSITESLLALAAFVIGATVGGKLSSLFANNRAKILSVSASVQSFLLMLTVILSLLSSTPVHGSYRTGFVVVLGIAMGVQNAAARRIAVPDLTTTVLTLTITGLGADSKLVGGSGSRAGRRLVAVAAMLLGAVIGAVLDLHTALCFPLVAALVVVLVVAAWVTVSGQSNDAWTKA
jgi:uncharacterized membrane protein YoaK (UPF0700 family)